MRFTCEHCGKSITAPDSRAGTMAKCPGCLKPIRVPALAGVSAASGAEREASRTAETPKAPEPEPPHRAAGAEHDDEGDGAARPAAKPAPRLIEYCVSGTMASSGFPVSVRILAASIRDAIEAAHKDGIVAAEVVDAAKLAQTSAPAAVAQPPVAVVPYPAPSKVQVIEQTAKLWKAVQLIGVFGILVGFTLALVGMTALPKTPGAGVAIAGGVLLAVGVLAWVTGRVAAWWFHG